MELRQLHNFVKVAELENVTRAAAELHMAQPPLSRQIQSLEAELGVPLFERDRRRIHLTPEGRLFREQSEQILELVDKSVEQVRQMRQGIAGTVFIGAIETAGTMLLPGWIAAFRAAYPAARYNLWSGNSNDVIERLERGLIDLALIREPFDGEKFDSLHVLDEEWVAMVRSDHALAAEVVGDDAAKDDVAHLWQRAEEAKNRFEASVNDGEDHFGASAESAGNHPEPSTETPEGRLELGALAGEPLIVPTRRTNEIKGWFTEAGLEANVLCEFAPLMNAVSLVEAGVGIAICPESASHALGSRPIVLRRLSGCPQSSGVSLIWRRDHTLPQTEQRFVELVSSLV